MTSDQQPSAATDPTAAEDAHRVAERAHLLPEEIAAGSDDPSAQAEQILAESDRRTNEPEATQEESTQSDESTAEQRAASRSV